MIETGYLDEIKDVHTLVVPVCEDDSLHEQSRLSDMMNWLQTIEEFKGKKDTQVTLYHPDALQVKRVQFYGMGKRDELTAEKFRTMAGNLIQQGIKQDVASIGFVVPCQDNIPVPPETIIESMMEGACLANYIFDRFKANNKQHPMDRIVMVVDPDMPMDTTPTSDEVTTVCGGTQLARFWVSLPSNHKTPEQFVKIIEDEVKKTRLHMDVLDVETLKTKKFGALLAVGQGSVHPPAVAILEHRVEGSDKTVALVGKGVTFDSGGICIKTRGGMETMKSDMAGAAAVVATLLTVARLDLPINVVGVVPLVENMPSGNAIRPGDIIRAYNGKTIEIGNTDAEGRLILADAMAYAIERYKPHIVVDVATLTGACITALGEKIAGVFSNDDQLADAIIRSSEKTHERCWRLPLPEDYRELLKSEFADTNNIGSIPSGGAITAALFLSQFVGDTKWAHIDIAGPAYDKKGGSYHKPGGTGFGVRLLWHLLKTL